MSTFQSPTNTDWHKVGASLSNWLMSKNICSNSSVPKGAWIATTSNDFFP